MNEPVRIKHKSLFQMKEDESLYGLKYLEGGSYIHDWLHKMPQHSYSSVTVTDKLARFIIEDAGMKYESYGNKDFFRFTTDEEKSGFNEEVVISFLYRHDFRWAIYTLF